MEPDNVRSERFQQVLSLRFMTKIIIIIKYKKIIKNK